MSTTLLGLILLAVILLVAVCRKNSVKFQMQFLGTRVHLETEGRDK